ncbi:hypothetical protein GCK72_001038 [Caenorhabditis remanei]|uniref:Uncharacterized protein n=1 Tax=Caenorhabditis remanei TaxID=31234 RepID=A0A6A5HRI2_CAERE|nr:hypothetical protein GCK72_001038 [Caenorhabditis remanei]KAF1769224.1 hypothetical protein GCK72_001038 [Caenorhabditis remanei]
MSHVRSSDENTKAVKDLPKAYKNKPTKIEGAISDQIKKIVHAPRTPLKRKREEKEGEDDGTARKMEWLKAKAKDAVIPSETNAVVKPEYLFKEPGALVFNICNPCKQFNSERQGEVVKTGMVQIPLALCTVCRHHLNLQRQIKFFQLEIPTVKKEFNL